MKKHKLIGLVMSIIGVLAYATADFASIQRSIGMLVMFIGIGWFIVGRAFD